MALLRRIAPFMFVFVLVALGKAQSYEPYVIESFSVRIDLRADAVLQVEETLRVRFNTAKHGIYRMIPVDYPSRGGLSRSVLITNVGITDESGTPQTTKLSRKGPNLEIRVGDAEVLLEQGTVKTYRISYIVEGARNWFEDAEDWKPSAELYWNATGNEWDTTIETTHVEVHFPSSGEGQGVRGRVFVGPYGSQLEDRIEVLSDGADGSETSTRLVLRSDTYEVDRDSPLPAYNGLTVALQVPAELIPKPPFIRAVMMFLKTNLGFLIPVVLFLPLFLLWNAYGRDPRGRPIATQFDPPNGISGAEAGTLIDERVDTRDLAAGIISLAVKGYVTITPVESGMIFKKRSADIGVIGKDHGPELTVFELSLLRQLEACGPTVSEVDLRTYVAPGISALRNSLYESLVDFGYYKANPNSVRLGWTVAGIVGVAGLAFLATVLTPFHSLTPGIIGGIIGAIIVIVFGQSMPKRTHAGAKARDQVLGFAEFLKRAQSKELEWMSVKHPDQAMFERFLPHAVAFGCVMEWGKAFEGIVNEMPSWYMGPRGMPFSPYLFASDFNSLTDSVGSAAATPPRSSGASGGGSGFSSGGGFSGGGFGGGGGGSW